MEADPLFETICSRETLYLAWLRVKEKKAAGGVDQKTVQDYGSEIDRNLDELAGQLQVGTYIQHPYREVLIPKNQNEKN